MTIRWTEEQYRLYREQNPHHTEPTKRGTVKHAAVSNEPSSPNQTPFLPSKRNVMKAKEDLMNSSPPMTKTKRPAKDTSTSKKHKTDSVTAAKNGGSEADRTDISGLAQSLIALGLGDKVSKPKKGKTKAAKTEAHPIQDAPADGGGKPEKKKKRGVETAPIFQSLVTSNAVSAWGEDWLAIDMPGARVLTYNEMFSILQYRKFEAFRYKKLCRELIRRAIKNTTSTTESPFFNGPTRLTLLRVGTREMDRDALPVVFKYFLDTLKREKKHKEGEENPNIIDDDNPNIIVDIVTLQDKGEPRLAMMLEKIPDWNKSKAPSWNDWMNARHDQEFPVPLKTLRAKRTKGSKSK